MASVLSLPLELYLQIIGELEPTDIFSLAFSCKALWESAASILEEHRKLYDRWKTLSLNNANYGGIDPTNFTPEDHARLAEPTSAWTYFRTICEDPRIRFHVRELKTNADFEPPRAELIEQCRLAARTSSATADVDEEFIKQAFEQALDQESDQYVAVLLLKLCPNVTSINHVNQFDELEDFLENAVWGLKSKPPYPLLKLKSAHVEHNDTEGGFEIGLCQSMISLPSIRSFSGHMVYGELTERPDLPTSNITSLELTCSCFFAEHLEMLISKIHALEKFTYEYGGNDIAYDYEPYDPIGFTTVLRKYTAHSLQDLKLIAPDFTDDFTRKRYAWFKPFTKIRHLFIDDLRALAEIEKTEVDTDEDIDSIVQRDPRIEEDETPQIEDGLPATLETLSLYEGAPVELYRRLVELKETQFPSFQKLSIFEMGSEKMATVPEKQAIEDFKEFARERGVEFAHEYRGYW